jgi:hypothetical protein
MNWRNLPKEMRQQITEYYEHRYQGKIFNEDLILNEMSETIREVIDNFFNFFHFHLIFKGYHKFQLSITSQIFTIFY